VVLLRRQCTHALGTCQYSVALLSIAGKVEQILDALKEHLLDLGGSGNAWSEREFYANDPYEVN
jgi:hypothetical protein